MMYETMGLCEVCEREPVERMAERTTRGIVLVCEECAPIIRRLASGGTPREAAEASGWEVVASSDD